MHATGCECRLLPCLSERSTAAVTKPFRAECSAVMLSSMQLAANAGLLQQEQPAADAGCCRARASEALQRKRSPSGLVCGACRDERDAAACECRLLPCMQPAANAGLLQQEQPTAAAGCCRDRDREGKDAQMEPFKAECSACRDERVQLRANAGCCHASNRLRMQAVAVPRTAKQCCANGALQGGVQRLQG